MPIREKTRRSGAARMADSAIKLRTRPHSNPKLANHKPVTVELKKSPVSEGARPSGPVHSYSQALRFLSTLSDFERLRIVRYNTDNFNLDRMRLLLKKLGNPQDHFRSVHVAGTKGKGSTCAMIASMLQANGYKT